MAGLFLRLAGVMGCSAVILGAYGAHRKYPKQNGDELKAIFRTANTYHFFHTLVLFTVNFWNQPLVIIQ